MRTFLIIIFIVFFSIGQAETRRSDTISLRAPIDIPLYLAGNFGELRRNHFHSGIDFKTQGKTGFPVHAADDGYVSRASVSPWGFGRAVYVTHPSTGLTTVYGHLEAFSPTIDKKVRSHQYERESFSIDLSFTPDELPVKKGDIIGISGNAGSSGGPHVHFDVRDTETGDALDPLEYFRNRIKDDVKPEVRQIALYPSDGGIVDGNIEKGAYRVPGKVTPFKAWGKVMAGIKAYDRMTGTSNIYGVKYMTLLQNNDTIYHRVIDRSAFETTRAVHTLINNHELAAQNAWIMVSEIPASHPLDDMVWAKDNGIITIDSAMTYKFTWVLRDEHGNTTRFPFEIQGVRSSISAPVADGQLMLWNADNLHENANFIVGVPENALYDNEFIKFSSVKNSNYLSDVVTIGSEGVALAKPFEMSISITTDTLQDKNQYCLVKINGAKRSTVTSRYENGWIDASPSSFGRYAVTMDTVPPKITPITKEKWKTTKEIKFKITDNLSGVETWRGEIDGRFALFELDGKTATLSFKLDPERFPGSSHDILLRVTDACGNVSEFNSRF